MRELDKVLDINEKVFWEGRPVFWPYFLSGAIPIFIFGLLFTLASTVYLSSVNVLNFFRENPVPASVFTLMLAGFMLGALWMLIGSPIYKWLLYKRLYYAITNKRVIIQKGVIGRDFEYIDFDQVTNAEVVINFWDKVFGKTSGSILVSSAGAPTYIRRGQEFAKPYTMSNIANPYDVFKFFKKVSHDVKTDIEYPNKLRPDQNPGYQSNYDPNKK